ncbi:MAG TPA: hypothetical protein VK035_01510 [Kiloniellales bacterium]|nr:hypothetical protein [Kiloniellales bacterium]
MRVLIKPLLLGVLLLLGACSGTGPTPYQPAERPGGQGYSEERVSEDTYRITVAGNSLTSRDRIEDYLLFRAAELTLLEGYDHFLLLERQTDSDTVRYYDNWGPMWGPGWAWQPYWGGYYGSGSRYGTGIGMSFGGGPSGNQTRYMTTALVQLTRGMPSTLRGSIYEARRVMDDLGPRIWPAADRQPAY